MQDQGRRLTRRWVNGHVAPEYAEPRQVLKFFCHLALGPIVTESMTCNFRLSNKRLKSLGFSFEFPKIEKGIPDVVRRWQAMQSR